MGSMYALKTCMTFGIDFRIARDNIYMSED